MRNIAPLFFISFITIFSPLFCFNAIASSFLAQSTREIFESEDELIVIPVGINVGKRNIIPSVLVKGLENDSGAVNLPNWLIPFDNVVNALKLKVDKQEDGIWQVIAPGLVTRIDSQELIDDPDIGLAISVQQIQTWLKVPTEFDLLEYAIVFNPPWSDFKDKRLKQEEIPVVIEGLPRVSPGPFTISTLGQDININGTIAENSTNNNTNYRGELTAIGTLLGGGLYVSTEQNKFNQTINWNLREAQWWYQGDAADYIVGSQPTFWRREQEGDYWGVTTIRRWGFQPQQKSFGAFNPNQRFQPNQVERTITGEAPPNTLARLLSRFDDRIIDEVLVDESGIYTFENIPTKGENYRVLLYPDGLLINEPIIEDIKFTDVPQLLPKGASVLTLSTGFRRKREGQEFIGELKNFGGGVAYRLGVLEDITLGVGLYNEGEAFRSLGEIFYQPAKIPLRVSVSALSPGSDSPWELLSRINFNPSPNFSLSLNGDRFGQRAQMNWRLSQNFSLIASGQNDNSDYSWATGIRFSRSGRFASTFGRVEIDNKNNLLLSVIQRFGSLRLEHRQNKDSSESEISYNFSGKRFFDEGHSLVFDYDTKNNSNRNDNLGIIRWRYRSERKLRDGFPLWEFNLGYGSGSRGSGVIASIATAAIPGGILRLTYQQVSLSSDNSQFRLDFFPRLNIQNGIRSGPNLRDFDLLRSEGGLWIKPFYDYNNNGIIDGPDEIFTEDANLMLVLNNKAIDRSRPEIKKDGVFITVPQGIYRLDLDRAGFPFDWSSNISALAVKVVPGSYTEVLIPFSLSYTFTGVVTNAEGKPINGAKIEAKPIGEGETIFSITNPGGVYYLEGLKQGIYNLTINGKPAQPNQLIINQSSEPFQELNLR